MQMLLPQSQHIPHRTRLSPTNLVQSRRGIFGVWIFYYYKQNKGHHAKNMMTGILKTHLCCRVISVCRLLFTKLSIISNTKQVLDIGLWILLLGGSHKKCTYGERWDEGQREGDQDGRRERGQIVQFYHLSVYLSISHPLIYLKSFSSCLYCPDNFYLCHLKC